MRPRARYSAGADIELWLTRFELYVRELGIAQNQWTRELLPLLEDEPFRVVTQLGLVHSTDYKAVTTGLRQQFDVEGNELEWQHQLQSRTQRPGEKFAEYAGCLRVLADKAYPKWSPEQRQEVLRNHFIQGVHSSTVQLYLMQEMPSSLDEALQLAVQRQSVELAQKRLHKERSQVEPTFSLQTSPAAPDAANAVAVTNSRQIAELAKQLQRLTEEVAQLQNLPSALLEDQYVGDAGKEAILGATALRSRDNSDREVATDKEEPKTLPTGQPRGMPRSTLHYSLLAK